MYIIKPLKQGELTVPLSTPIGGCNPQTMITLPVYIWVLEHQEEVVVVDAGIEGHVPPPPIAVRAGGEKMLRDALGKLKLKPENIGTLILTHLHPDHVGLAKLFHNARIYVQKREWDSAFNPPMTIRHTKVYDEELFLPLENMDLCLVDGDYEIIEGIKLILLPGHSAGMQGVAVRTKDGTYLIAGDQFDLYLNIFPPKHPTEIYDLAGNLINIPPIKSPFAPPGWIMNVVDWCNSCYKTLSITRRNKIIPGHDPSICGQIFPSEH